MLAAGHLWNVECLEQFLAVMGHLWWRLERDNIPDFCARGRCGLSSQDAIDKGNGVTVYGKMAMPAPARCIPGSGHSPENTLRFDRKIWRSVLSQGFAMAVFSSSDTQRFYIFIQCEPGKTYEVGLAIAEKHLPYVTEISSVSGEWDLLLRVAIDKRLDLGRVLAEQLLDVKGVMKTNTIGAYDVR
jgi:DNA-binding Lrp family transcriptional regulator